MSSRANEELSCRTGITIKRSHHRVALLARGIRSYNTSFFLLPLSSLILLFSPPKKAIGGLFFFFFFFSSSRWYDLAIKFGEFLRVRLIKFQFHVEEASLML